MGLYLRGSTWWMKFKRDGLTHRESCETQDRRKADVIYRKAIDRRDDRKFAEKRGLPVPEEFVDPKIDLDEFLKKFREHYVNAGGPDFKESREASWNSDVSQLKSVLDFLKKHGMNRPAKVTRRSAEAYRDWRLTTGCSVETVKKAIRCARAAWSWAIEAGYTTGANPFSKIKFPRGAQSDPRNLSEEEIEKVLEAARAEGGAVFAMLAIAIYAGLRRAELAALEWTDVSFGEAGPGYIRVRCDQTFRTKSRKPRTTPLSPELAEILRPLAMDSGLCFPSPATGERWKGTSITKAFTRIAEAAGVEFTPHDLRRTCASIMAARGIPTTRIRDYLGHASVATTEGYYLARGTFDPGDAAKLTFAKPKGSRKPKTKPAPAPRARKQSA